MAIYMDHNATTPLRVEVRQAMVPYVEKSFGNASSVHAFGREAAKGLNRAREQVAAELGCRPEEIVFTGGGTEADNLAIKGVAYAHPGTHIITSQIEHHAVLHSCQYLERRGFSVTYLAVDEYGMVDPDDVREAITDGTVLISVMHANNEVGTIQPIAEIGRIASDNGVVLHTDAVQSFGKLPISVDELGVDLLTLSAHKIYGPKGVGALYVRHGTELEPLLHGGHHEHGLRAGTENVTGIVGLGRAAELAMAEMEEEGRRLAALRERLWEGMAANLAGVRRNGHPTRALPNTLNVCFEYLEGEAILMGLDAQGIAVSTGSACTSDVLEPSHVLLAMGVPPLIAQGSVRFGLGRGTTKQEIDDVVAAVTNIVQSLQAASPLSVKETGV
ncbi:MAG: cysteine desulfurase NifS [Anaerolineae bacterium]|nr:cysteine desulfurase NifS [Anaerolineae bacterium]